MCDFQINMQDSRCSTSTSVSHQHAGFYKYKCLASIMLQLDIIKKITKASQHAGFYKYKCLASIIAKPSVMSVQTVLRKASQHAGFYKLASIMLQLDIVKKIAKASQQC